jgi:MFS family permease
MGGLLTLPSFVETFTEMDVNNTTGDVLRRNTETQGITVAIYEIGCAAGALSTLTLGDKWGRRKILFLGGFIVTLGAILHCASFGLPQLIVGRIVSSH